MAKEIPSTDREWSRFISGERGKVLTFLRKNYSVSDDDLDDIFQEASKAIFLNVQEGKLTSLTSSLNTYFMKVCINQTLKFIGKKSKVMPLIDENRISNKNAVRDDKIDETGYSVYCINDNGEYSFIVCSDFIADSMLVSLMAFNSNDAYTRVFSSVTNDSYYAYQSVTARFFGDGNTQPSEGALVYKVK